MSPILQQSWTFLDTSLNHKLREPEAQQSQRAKAPASIEIVFDGGCFPNPGQKYGSWLVRVDGVEIINRNRFSFGHGTNNEAEFEALEMALGETVGRLKDKMILIRDCQVLVTTDSMIVKNRLLNNRIHKKPAYQAASQRMYSYAARCLNLLNMFGSFTVQWKGRENNVELFGH